MVLKYFWINFTYLGAINNQAINMDILHDQCPELIHCSFLGVGWA